MNYYEHHLGDYLRDTAHLTMLEDGAYRRLMDCYYVRESPLPSELREACRLVRAVTKQERDAVAAVLREFFIPGPDGWRHKRCDVEVARFQDKQRKAKASADARWSQSDRNANASADAMRTHSEGNATRERGRPRAPARPQTPDTRHQSCIQRMQIGHRRKTPMPTPQGNGIGHLTARSTYRSRSGPIGYPCASASVRPSPQRSLRAPSAKPDEPA